MASLRGLNWMHMPQWFQRVALGPSGSTPVKAPLHLKPTAAPSGTASEGDLYFSDSVAKPLAYSGSAYYILGNGQYARVADATAATLAPVAADSGTMYQMDRAGGIAVTLPAAVAGLSFGFTVRTTFTSNATITAASGDLLIGGLFSIDTDSSNAVAYFPADGSDDLIITLNGTTTGGLVRTHIHLFAVDDDRWLVEGVNFGSGVVATPFS